MSLDWMLPWEQQATTYDTDELRFIEINEDDEDVDDGQCKSLLVSHWRKKLRHTDLILRRVERRNHELWHRDAPMNQPMRAASLQLPSRCKKK